MVDISEAAVGIEFGSTNIKAVLVSNAGDILAEGKHGWENSFQNGIWTYPEEEIIAGLQECFRSLKKDAESRYGTPLKKVKAIGISGMMHGLLAFDGEWKLLTPFRTWRNNNAEKAAQELSELFRFNIPARYSIAHLYQTMIDREDFVPRIAHITTLSGYIHFLLTGRNVLGIGEASGMFPIDPKTRTYRKDFVELFDEILEKNGLPFRLLDILPSALLAGEEGGRLSEKGARLLDPEEDLVPGIPLCPPEGDAGTGMVATGSVRKRTGNISAGTSVFGMAVLEKDLSKAYPEIDVVTTPLGDPVAMVHCNNCAGEIDRWMGLFEEYNRLFGIEIPKDELYAKLFRCSLTGEKDCGGVLSYNYLSGENIARVKNGHPMLVRKTNGKLSLANLMRSELYSSVASLRIGFEILEKEENVKIDSLFAQGGIFRTEGVMQEYLAAALNVPVSLSENASSGGPWGMALLAHSLFEKENGGLLPYLDNKISRGKKVVTVVPDPETARGFEKYAELYRQGLELERKASDIWEEK